MLKVITNPWVHKYQHPNIEIITSVGKWTSMGVYEGQ